MRFDGRETISSSASHPKALRGSEWEYRVAWLKGRRDYRRMLSNQCSLWFILEIRNYLHFSITVV